MGIKDFGKATLKISLAIFIAAIALGLVIWAAFAVHTRSEKIEAAKYEVAKDWSLDVKKYLQMEVSAKTKLVDGRLRIAVNVDGYPAYLSHPSLEARNRNAALLIIFQDADGFKVYDKRLTISDFSTTVDAQGKKIGLNGQFDDYMSVNNYKSFALAKLQWTLQTELPTPSKAPAALVVEQQLDPCAPSLSRGERLRRLGTHGMVRQTGSDSFTAGSRYIAFYPDNIGGGLISCR